ncbi:DUF4158 domain-containing protein [Kitasatospora sp. NPDC057542]
MGRQPVGMDELVEHWTVLDDEADLVAGKRGGTRVGFALLLKFYTRHDRFPRGRVDFPDEVVEFVARQMHVPAADFESYQWTGSTIEYHRAQTREHLGFRVCLAQDAEKLTAWLAGNRRARRAERGPGARGADETVPGGVHRAADAGPDHTDGSLRPAHRGGDLVHHGLRPATRSGAEACAAPGVDRAGGDRGRGRSRGRPRRGVGAGAGQGDAEQCESGVDAAGDPQADGDSGDRSVGGADRGRGAQGADRLAAAGGSRVPSHLRRRSPESALTLLAVLLRPARRP